jgi:hypothetical protein
VNSQPLAKHWQVSCPVPCRGTYRVSSEMDVVLLHVGEEVVALLEQGVSLDLVDNRRDTSGLDACLDVGDAEVRHTHSTGFGLGKLDHGYDPVSELFTS